MGSDLSRVCFALPTKYISIHAPRVGSDILRYIIPCSPYVFQSTLPVWGATSMLSLLYHSSVFQSTLPVWGATYDSGVTWWKHGISIHAPRVGSDQSVGDVQARIHHFNPRSPCGERHDIHGLFPNRYNFNPRSPCGERQKIDSNLHLLNTFQSTLPVWGATCQKFILQRALEFQSTLPVWGATGIH